MNVVKQNQMKLSITKLSSYNVSNKIYNFRKIFRAQTRKYFTVQQ